MTPDELSTDVDIKALQLQRQRYLDAFQGQADTIHKALLGLPESNPHKAAALAALDEAWWTNQALLAIVQDGEAALAGMQAALEMTQQQRDEIAGELDGLMAGMQNVWGTRHPIVTALYEQIIDSHNAAFWESLPYDIAATLGERWTHMDAGDLYTLLTTDLDLFDDEGMEYGFTREQALLFRQSLWETLQLLKEANDG